MIKAEWSMGLGFSWNISSNKPVRSLAKGICWCIDRVTTQSLFWCVGDGRRDIYRSQQNSLPDAYGRTCSRQLRSDIIIAIIQAIECTLDWTPPVSRIMISYHASK